MRAGLLPNRGVEEPLAANESRSRAETTPGTDEHVNETCVRNADTTLGVTESLAATAALRSRTAGSTLELLSPAKACSLTAELHLCNTFGCILANNHPGLHLCPEPGKRGRDIAPSLPAPKRRPPEPCSTPTDGSSEEERHRLSGVPPPEHRLSGESSSDSEYDLIPLSQRLAFRRGEQLASAVATKGVSVHERGAGWQPHGGGVEAPAAEAAAGAELAWLQAGRNLLDFGGKVWEAVGETGEAATEATEAADMQTEASAGAGASSAVQADAAADGASAGASSSSSAVPIDAAADGAAGSAAFADADASSARPAWRHEPVCCTCGRDDGDESLLLCDGLKCSVAQHTFCCSPPLASVPSGKWLCDACQLKRMPSFREQLAQALEASRAEEPELALEDYGRRVPLDQRPPKPPRDPPAWSQDADGVRTLRLAQQAPRLDFVRAVQRGTIVDGYGNRVAGTVYDEATDQPIESSALNAHPDPRAVSSDGCKAARVLTEENVEEDLEAPFISPPAAGEEAAWKVFAAGGALMCKICFLPAHDGAVKAAADQAVLGVADALEKGSFQPDQKTGGGYVVAGNGCMQSSVNVTRRLRRTRADGTEGASVVVPYTRLDTFRPGVRDAVQGAAPLMGRVAEHIGKVFPETTREMASAARFHPVVKDLFMRPSPASQRERDV
mmetsp:Transcript_25901/g.77564  ORF Transcript_25901/g.77564 Transcript_25901/m.77564 type:complete len:673 (-) Transcript_25901:734-2752(-)